MANTNNKTVKRQVRRRRIRSKVKGTDERPRVSVFKSNRTIFAQLINDEKGVTIASTNIEVKKGGLSAQAGKTEQAIAAGKDLAAKASGKGVKKIVFDRGGYIYTGRIKAFAEALREAGLDF